MTASKAAPALPSKDAERTAKRRGAARNEVKEASVLDGAKGGAG